MRLGITKKSRTRVLAACVALSVPMIATTACVKKAGGNDKITINVGHVVSAKEPTHLALKGIAERVSERTNGKLTLKLFPEGQLGENRDMQEQMMAGAAQIAQLDPGYAAEATGVDEMNVLGGPFLFDNIDDVNAVLDSDLMKEWTAKMEKAGVHSLTWKYYFGERHIISNRGYPKPEDLKGVKIRVPPNPSWIATFKALPTSPTTLEWEEVYPGMQQGVVDAAEAPLATIKASSLYEVAKTITLTSHFKAITGWGISTQFWNTLSPEYQKVLTEEFAKGAEEMTRMTLEQESQLRKEFKEKLGVTLVEPDIEAYKKASMPYYSAFPKWRDGLYEQLQKIMAEK